MAPTVPTEIIYIILYELSGNSDTAVTTAMAVSSISHQWRVAALSTPSLWSTFSFSLRKHHTDFLSVFFERSLPNLLDVTISSDFETPDQVLAVNVQRAIELLLGEADRLERLHIRCYDHMYGSNVLAQIISIRSSTLKRLEMEALHKNRGTRVLMLDYLFREYSSDESWSLKCPVLTHIIVTDMEFLLYFPPAITYLCIKGVPRRRTTFFLPQLRYVLDAVTALTELVIDGVSIQLVHDGLSLPHLRALSLRNSPSRDGTISNTDTKAVANFLRLLHAPALVSLTIPEFNMDLPSRLKDTNVRIPSIT